MYCKYCIVSVDRLTDGSAGYENVRVSSVDKLSATIGPIHPCIICICMTIDVFGLNNRQDYMYMYCIVEMTNMYMYICCHNASSNLDLDRFFRAR